MNFFRKHTAITALLIYFIIGFFWGIIFELPNLTDLKINWHELIWILPFFVFIWPYQIFFSGNIFLKIFELLISLSVFIIFGLWIRRVNQKEANIKKN